MLSHGIKQHLPLFCSHKQIYMYTESQSRPTWNISNLSYINVFTKIVTSNILVKSTWISMLITHFTI